MMKPVYKSVYLKVVYDESYCSPTRFLKRRFPSMIMNVLAVPELSTWARKVESQLELALQERENRTLAPPNDLNVSVHYYNAQRSRAFAFLSNGQGMINVNILPCMIDQCDDLCKEKIVHVTNYFDIVRDFLRNPHEQAILTLIKDPEKTLNTWEAADPELPRIKKFFSERGTPYDHYREATINNAPIIAKFLEDINNAIPQSFSEEVTGTIRHELDHIAFFQSQWYHSFHHVMEKRQALRTQVQNAPTNESSQELARTSLEMLETACQILPALEARANFFNFIKPTEWQSANYQRVCQQVQEKLGTYVTGIYTEEILDALIAVAWSQNKMDRMTSNHLFQTIHHMRGSTDAVRYQVAETQVNHLLAKEILENQLPHWMNKYLETIKQVTPLVAAAYQHTPERLRMGNEVRSYVDFLKALKN